jgi:hypothetical protein
MVDVRLRMIAFLSLFVMTSGATIAGYVMEAVQMYTFFGGMATTAFFGVFDLARVVTRNGARLSSPPPAHSRESIREMIREETGPHDLFDDQTTGGE